MCRLFGFRSNVAAPVHSSLLGEQNSLRTQSREHKDGWGIASYDGELPEVAHGLGPAHGDPEFERVSNLLSSHAVIAHVRLASVGRIHLLNAHPFIHGRWSFAHNGTVRDFAMHQRAIESEIAADLRSQLRGETDSERCFFLFLTRLRALTGSSEPTADDVARALAQVTHFVTRLTDKPDDEKPTSLNLLVTDGNLMVASRLNRTLFFSEQKSGLAAAERPAAGTRLDQLVIASERMQSEHHWHEVPEGSMVGVGPRLTLRFWRTDDLAPPSED